MKLSEAKKMIRHKEKSGTYKKPGYMISFEKHVGSLLHGDYFPDVHAGEKLIKSESEAWDLAQKFASATDPKTYINIYVTDSELKPVPDYRSKIIRRYQP